MKVGTHLVHDLFRSVGHLERWNMAVLCIIEPVMTWAGKG